MVRRRLQLRFLCAAVLCSAVLLPQSSMAQPSSSGTFSRFLMMAQTQASGQVSGTVTYRQRIALPPSAVVEVRLQEVSRLDAPAVTIAEQIIETEGRQVPFAFTLNYDPSEIDPRFTYVVQARITVDDELQWINTTAYRVITQGAPETVEVIVSPARSAAPPTSPPTSTPSSPPSSSASTRYDCEAQARGYEDAENVRLDEAERLLMQRSGKKFAYICEPTTASANDFRYDCQPQVANYPDRRNVTLAEAERLIVQRSDNSFIYQCEAR
ncbi:MAG: hypothetical protein HC827_09400 [Cyanobacteria bacterium RM1_2_2]|nr:hypothetical protein [Cyanobacteria bacterium RM1_2_2]